MDPITLWIRVDLAREEALAVLDELANHVVDWSLDRPAAGVGGPARTRAIVPVRNFRSELHETHQRFALDALPDGATRVRFELEYLEIPRSERLRGPLIRAYMKRANTKAMRRLKQALERSAAPAPAIQHSGHRTLRASTAEFTE